MKINANINLSTLQPAVEKVFEYSATKVKNIEKSWNPQFGTPVFTENGIYTSCGWTEWTRGFHYGSIILQYDATGDQKFLDIGRKAVLNHMATHVSDIGVHDHGFNNVSTYGNLLRMMNEGRIEENYWERHFYELALKLSGAIQASRWTDLPERLGYIYSFNGPHSLFSDTIRSLRVLAISHQLNHSLMGETDEKINLLHRLLKHAEATSRYNVYFGKGRDKYDTPGRVAQESIFDMNNGTYRCPGTQQGYSPFTTWTRGLAWIIIGYAEQLEFLSNVNESEFKGFSIPNMENKNAVLDRLENTARITADFYLQEMPADGIPYWDTGAPNLYKIDNYLNKPADPFNDYEPVDSSAAAISAQGFLRLGKYLEDRDKINADRYFQAGLTIADTLFKEPYLSSDQNHQGLLLHSVYHHPKSWDHIQQGKCVPCGEATMWGDYHARELALYIKRLAQNDPYLKFYLD
jgi:hypothetical protein